MKIVAIGGGEIGRPGFPIETTAIDKEIISLTGKNHPKLLFIPTASSDSEGYISVVRDYFGKRLGCIIDSLTLTKANYTYKELEQKVFSTDIVYVGGGNTLKMMRLWRKVGLDKILKAAAEKDIVLAGVSAGAICWFHYGSSDSRKFANTEAGLIKVRGLGLIPALFCPHYDVEVDRKTGQKKLMEKTSDIGLAADNCSALEIVNGMYRVLASSPTAHVYKTFWKEHKYFETPIEITKSRGPLSDLLIKGS